MSLPRRVAKRKSALKRVLRLLDLEHSKRTLLSTLGSPDSKRAYEFAIDHFVAWSCSEPRLAFSKTVVLRYRLELEARQLAPATINLRLAAVRRLAFEAADTGLLSPELAAGIARVKGASILESWRVHSTAPCHEELSRPRFRAYRAVIWAVVEGSLVPVGYTKRFRGITGYLFRSEDLRKYRPVCRA